MCGLVDMSILPPFIMVEKRVDIMVVYMKATMRYLFLCSISKVSYDRRGDTHVNFASLDPGTKNEPPRRGLNAL
jgi:hypothetical protein